MTAESAISLALSASSLIGVAYGVLFRQAKIEARVELLWGFLLRRGVAEGLSSGLMEKMSPLRLNVQLLDLHPEITHKVQDFYASAGKKLSDIKLIEEIEKRWGTDLSLLSAANNMATGAMLSALLFFVRPEMDIFKQFDTTHWHRKKSDEAK